MKICRMCGNEFVPSKINQLSCSDCFSDQTKSLYVRSSKRASGAISEHLVIIDLIGKGYNVYKAIDGNAPVDLMIFKNHVNLRIEVKTGNRKRADISKLFYGKHSNQDYDYLAVVIPEEHLILYVPKGDATIPL